MAKEGAQAILKTEVIDMISQCLLCLRAVEAAPKANAVVMFSFLGLFLTACDGGSGGVLPSSGSTSTPDTTAPSINITVPAASVNYSTSNSTVTVSGTASDSVGVTQVTWSNNRGGSGTASGTTAWSISSVALQSGSNTVTATARDSAGNTNAASISISLTVPSTPIGLARHCWKRPSRP